MAPRRPPEIEMAARRAPEDGGDTGRDATRLRSDAEEWRCFLFQFTNGSHSSLRLRQAAAAYQLAIAGLIVGMFFIDATGGLDAGALSILIRGVALAAFGADYGVRIFCCVEGRPGGCPESPAARWAFRLVFALKPFMLLDMVSMLGLFLDMVLTGEKTLGFMAFRFFRLFLFLRFERDFHVFGPIIRVINKRWKALAATLCVSGVFMLIAATAMFHLEFGVNPNFRSLGDGCWWATAALTTVGYGDVVPRTRAGQLLGGLVAFMGVGLFGLPAGILASGFQEEWSKMDAAAPDRELHDRAAGAERRLEELRAHVDVRLGALQEELAAVRDGQRQILELLRQRPA